MKKIKIYLQYPWKYVDSPYYKYLLEDLPKNIEYFNKKNAKKGATHNNVELKILYSLKKYLRILTNKLKLVMPNAHLNPKGNYDLIHCAHCLSKNRDKSWVCDVEGVWSLFISGSNTKKGINKVKKYLIRKNCRKILPWTESVKKELLEMFPEIVDKIKVIYPAIPEKKNLKQKPKNKINLIFSARYFYQKGGLHAIEAIDILTKKHKEVYGIFISNTPKEILEKYKKNEKIKFYPLMPQKKLFELYEQSHILVYPGYSDSFGFAYLEAMSFGVPTISVDKDYRKEIIENGKTGFLISPPKKFSWKKIYNEEIYKTPKKEFIIPLVKETEKLIKDKRLLNKMSKECIKVIKEGKFSIKKRNKKLEKIYMEALN